jgi:methylmalonyl-CoA/ethylmalonyl-CoA epimerase
MEFNHEGVAGSDIEQEKIFYEQLGFKQSGDIFEDHNQKIRGMFVNNGTMSIELLEPLGEDSPLLSFLKRNNKIYQHAFLVQDLDIIIEEFRDKKGWILLGDPQPAVAFNGKRIVFFYANGIIIEFIEK